MAEPRAWVAVTEGAEHGLWTGCAVNAADWWLQICWDLHSLPCCQTGADPGCDSGCWLDDSIDNDEWAQQYATLKEAAARKKRGGHPIGLDRWASDVVK